MRETGVLRNSVAAALLGISVLSTLAQGIGLPRAVKGNGFLSVPVHESRRNTTGITKRDTIESILANQGFFYTMDIEIGTPGQLITVLLDTGSSDLWVNPNCSSATSATQKGQCLSFGHYDPASSTTPPVGPVGHKTIRYGDPSNPNTLSKVEIDFYADDLAIVARQGDPTSRHDYAATIVNQTFGVVVQSNGQSQGILGLAPDLNAGFDGEQADKPYNHLLDNLVAQGLIGRRAFSLDLRHADSDEGAIIFGGLDRSKFIGALEPVPLIDGIRGEPRLAIKLDAVTTTIPGASPPTTRHVPPDGSRNVMLDSGTTLSRLHANAAHSILRPLGARSLPDNYWLAPCSHRDTPVSRGSVDFDMGNKTLRVPLSDFILDLKPNYSDDLLDDSDEEWCYVGLVLTADQQVLGDSILRAGYFVFDWDDRLVHVAQASNCGSEIVAIEKGKDVATLTGRCEADWAREDGSGATATGDGGDDDDEDSDGESPANTSSADPHQNNSSVGTNTAGASEPTESGDSDSAAGSLLSQLKGNTWVSSRHLSWILASMAAFTIAS